jgi:hypothetical protein
MTFIGSINSDNMALAMANDQFWEALSAPPRWPGTAGAGGPAGSAHTKAQAGRPGLSVEGVVYGMARAYIFTPPTLTVVQ